MVNRRFRYGFLVSWLAVVPVAGCASDADTEPVESSAAALGSIDVVISQIYGAGGNSGSPYKNDFIELFNRGAASVDLSTWSVQYASATGSSWNKTNLSGVLQPGQYYLIQEAAGTGTAPNLPTPDATGTLTLSGTTGKVALVTSQTPLTCSTACLPDATIRDFVGYGSSATGFEGSGPTATLGNTASALRLGGG
jgi:predicted extracellular nuclease